MLFQKGHKTNLGKKYSKEHRENISKGLKGKKQDWLHNGMLGKKHSEETKRKMSLSQIGKKRKPMSEQGKKNISNAHKGLIPWNKGLTAKTDDRVKKYTEKNTGENNVNWKGENVSYRELHKWLNKKFGKPRQCQHCNSTSEKIYDWANISKEYKRDLDDWIRLCRSCHIKYDRKSKDTTTR